MRCNTFTRQAALIGTMILAAHAQETRSLIFGHVTDPSSAAVAGAKVSVKNIQTNVSTDLVTNDSGYYEAPLLVAGDYQVLVEAPGFRKSERPSFDLPIASRL